jgi:outer membrane protein OmpA-like peptidoglycan-associated protein
MMMTKKIIVWMGVFVLQTSMNLAIADESEQYSWYLGAEGGVTNLDPKTKNTGYHVSDDTDVGFKLFTGFDFTDSLTVEGFYTDLGSAKLKSSFASQKNKSIDYSTYGASALWYFWRNNKSKGDEARKGFQAYIHGGLSALDNSSSADFSRNNDVHFHYGAGLEYGLNNGIALRAGVDLYDKDASFIFVGVLKRFGIQSKRKVVAQPTPSSIVEPVIEDVPEPEPVITAVEPTPVEVPVKAPVVEPVVVVLSVVDSDKDGVIDSQDKCADSPVDIKVDESGCSIIALKIQAINFEPKSYELTDDSKLILDEAAITINASPELQKIEVQAHTDYKGSGTTNLKLSDQRAMSVKVYLISRGVDGNRLVAKGYGESQPIADNKTEKGRAKNRRVELKLVKDEVPEVDSE